MISPELASQLWPKWTDYIPFMPTGKQLAGMMLANKEIFYGGAAGGGKSIWLLMSSLQYADVPGYSSILFRKTLSDLKLANSLMDLSFQWLAGWPKDDPGKPQWRSQEHKWVFPCGPNYAYQAVLQFGYIGGGGEIEGSISNRYQSASFQFIGFDELAHHYQGDYEFMFSRLRGPALPCAHCGIPVERLPASQVEPGSSGWKHTNDSPYCEDAVPDPRVLNQFPSNGDGIRIFDIPLRMRAASNPPRAGDAGNSSDPETGKPWIKSRFRIQQVPVKEGDSLNRNEMALRYLSENGKSIPFIYKGVHPDRMYLPAFIWDNPYLKQEEYIQTLQNLDPITRAQQLAGDWGVSADGRFKRAWARRYSFQTDYVVLGPDKKPYGDVNHPPKHGIYHRGECQCFLTCDPAASTREGPGDQDIYRNRAPSWTVIGTWLVTPAGDLLLVHVTRLRCEVPEVLLNVRQEYNWACDFLDPSRMNMPLKSSGRGRQGYAQRPRPNTRIPELTWDMKNHLSTLEGSFFSRNLPGAMGHLPSHIGIENNGINLPIYQILVRSGLPIKGYNPGLLDPLARAADACNRMEQGKIYLPQAGIQYPHNQDPIDNWLEAFENELFTWIGHPHETDDQIAILSYAAMEVSQWAAESNTIEEVVELPFAI